jgi:hypothetical protein
MYIPLLFLGVFALFILLIRNQSIREDFLNDYCTRFTDCVSCADASGCAWCPAAKRCLDSTTLKSTDKECNQMNTVRSSFLCAASLDDKIPPKQVVQDDIMADYALYKNQITDKIPPPNLYKNGKVDISNQDVVSHANHVRNYIQNLHTELPGIIASTVENNIKPMVKGILAENYYIQGFKDIPSLENHENPFKV